MRLPKILVLFTVWRTQWLLDHREMVLVDRGPGDVAGQGKRPWALRCASSARHEKHSQLGETSRPGATFPRPTEKCHRHKSVVTKRFGVCS